MVPSCAIHKRDPFNLPTASPLVRITWAKGVLNRVQRAHSFKVLVGVLKNPITFKESKNLLSGPKGNTAVICPPNDQSFFGPLVFLRKKSSYRTPKRCIRRRFCGGTGTQTREGGFLEVPVTFKTYSERIKSCKSPRHTQSNHDRIDVKDQRRRSTSLVWS